MKKLAVILFNFIISINLYSFDFIEDTIENALEFIFDDLAKVIGMIAMIAAVVYFIKKFIKDDRSKKYNYKEYDNYDESECRRKHNNTREKAYDYNMIDYGKMEYDNNRVKNNDTEKIYEYDMRDYYKIEKNNK